MWGSEGCKARILGGDVFCDGCCRALTLDRGRVMRCDRGGGLWEWFCAPGELRVYFLLVGGIGGNITP